MRIAISGARPDGTYDTTPKNPTATSSSPTTPKRPMTLLNTRSSATFDARMRLAA
jgi:hypothetical protein